MIEFLEIAAAIGIFFLIGNLKNKAGEEIYWKISDWKDRKNK